MQKAITAKLKLHTDDYMHQIFFDMSNQYRLACQYISNIYFDKYFKIEQRLMHEKYYYKIKELFNLKSQQSISVIRTVYARYKSIDTQKSKKNICFKDKYTGKKHFYKETLEHLRKPVQFKSLQTDLVYNRDYRFTENGVKITTLGKLVEVKYDTKHFDKYLNNGWEYGTAKLVYKSYNKTWYLHISLTKDFNKEQEFNVKNVKHVVGIDLGLINTATIYDEKGRTTFISGKSNRQKRKNNKRLREELQSKNTKSSKKRFKSIGQRENRWMSDFNHSITKSLVEKYGPNTLFVLEDLDGLTQDTVLSNRENELTSWAFYQFKQYLTYKAEMNGSKVILVDPKYTSQRCPKCGSIHKESRDKKNSHYHCVNCGYQSNDDRIGAMNLYELGKMYVSGDKEPTFDKEKKNKKTTI